MSENLVKPKRRPRGDTRRALIDGAFKLLDGQKSFAGLSQRELTRAVGIVPTAFYRHFESMDALGEALVEEAFRGLRQILADVRTDLTTADHPVGTVTKSLIKHVRAHRARFRFIAAERFAGGGVVRDAIRREIRLVHAELAIELARFPYLRDWPVEDLHMISSLMINSMVAVAEEILERKPSDKAGEKELLNLAEKQLRLILLAVPAWKPQGAAQTTKRGATLIRPTA